MGRDDIIVEVRDKNWYQEIPDFIWIKEKIPLMERIKNFFKGNGFRKYRRRKVPIPKIIDDRDSVIINFS